ncbi:MAG: hypothetical protein IJS81_05920 [Selenomonadaceae bacterium]|nr:hypothetical protein [Selenomonadaceae bacterium]
MVKMILALPQHVDADKFTDTVKGMLIGRFGIEDPYYRGLWLYASSNISLDKVSKAYAEGYSGKSNLHYYTMDAEALDPVIIAAIEDLMSFIEGADYTFVTEEKKLSRDWWRPSDKDFQTWNGHYCDSESTDRARDEYDDKLKALNPATKIA